ncbi:hypothetical protein BN2497_4185 [Janthinobacterium sp. CG23_2]|nr:hypothetical protein BN2497_4185 [Janthinobacterium sp. CG23_2]CUU28490.1 hypothetical protein BN3177_4185 [Janthinobacterium sp. CG23_2]
MAPSGKSNVLTVFTDLGRSHIDFSQRQYFFSQFRRPSV